MTEKNKGGGDGLDRRRFLIRTAKASASLAALGVLSNISAGCGGGGGGGGGGAPSGPPAPPPVQQVTVTAATSKQGGMNGDNSFASLYSSQLYDGVGPAGNRVTGDLNYSPFQALGSDVAKVNVGDNLTWSVNGNGSGGPLTFAAS